MKIVISGGTGFLGTALCQTLAASGHEIVVLTRGAPATDPRRRIIRVRWDPDDEATDWIPALADAGAIVNLAGESIAGRRWTAAHKARILNSRIRATRRLVDAIKTMPAPPSVFVSGSAIGYYGSRGDETLTEDSAAGDDFLARVCIDWEREASAASSVTRVTLVRTGLVLDSKGGALPRMLPPFRAFAGGPLGSGRQYMSWIHRADWVRLVDWAIATPAAAGPFNATTPNPMRNREFSAALARALRRPSWLPAPAFALRLALGEMADALLLSSQKVLPARATELRFRFQYPDLDQALRDVLR